MFCYGFFVEYFWMPVMNNIKHPTRKMLNADFCFFMTIDRRIKFHIYLQL